MGIFEQSDFAKAIRDAENGEWVKIENPTAFDELSKLVAELQGRVAYLEEREGVRHDS